MVTKIELMGLGMPYPQANVLGILPIITSVSGAAVGSATQVGGQQYLIIITASNSGSGLKMPQVTGDNGCLPGDTFTIQNNLSASIAIYAANNAAGSAVTFYGNGVSAAGTTGFSIPTGMTSILRPINTSTWVRMNSLASA